MNEEQNNKENFKNDNINKKCTKNIVNYLIIFFVGCLAMYAVIYFFPTSITESITKLEKDVTVTDTGIADAVEKVYDAVVVVSTYRDDNYIASGTGFVYKKDDDTYYLLTNYHVIEDGDKVTVTFTDGSIKETTIVGHDEYADIAVLSLKSDEELREILPRLRIVARSLPQDKSRLVRIGQSLGLVVGMTGDGVNDAPALKKADVGFAMGSGTEVSKEASDIVILDDNFLSISKAILFGRTIFKSIRKFIIFQLTINLCAILLSVVGPFIGVETPVPVIQILWINMIMDTLAGIAFSYEPPFKEYMREPPKKKGEPIMNRYMIGEI